MDDQNIKKLIDEEKIGPLKMKANQFGEIYIPVEYYYELTEKGKAEVDHASNILKQYGQFIEPKEYLELKENFNKIKLNFSQTKERLNISIFLGVIWYTGVIFTAFINENKSISFIFTTLIFLIIIYLFIYKNDFDTF